jgi:hypothetical protein
VVKNNYLIFNCPAEFQQTCEWRADKDNIKDTRVIVPIPCVGWHRVTSLSLGPRPIRAAHQQVKLMVEATEVHSVVRQIMVKAGLRSG